jgi:hypothetical protein
VVLSGGHAGATGLQADRRNIRTIIDKVGKYFIQSPMEIAGWIGIN